MGYGRKIYDEACKKLEHSRREAESAAARKAEDFYRLCPKAREIKAEMGANACGAARAVIQGGDVRKALEGLRDKGLALQREYERLLSSHGLSPADLQPPYACPRCKDTGFADGHMCQCLKQMQRAMAFEALSMNAPLEKSTFERFSLDYYKSDPRAFRQMENILTACKDYAARFRSNSSSLLFRGPTGLGKTHLSLAIAGKAIEKAFRNQVENKGFSLVEVVSACPTNWGMTPQKALEWVESDMIPYYPLGVYKDRTAAKEAEQK